MNLSFPWLFQTSQSEVSVDQIPAVDQSGAIQALLDPGGAAEVMMTFM